MAPTSAGPPPTPTASAGARRTAVLAAVLCLTAGCSTIYYAAMSQLGWNKADLLANRVQLARDTLDQTRVQLADSLPDFARARSESGDRAARYQALNASYATAQANAALVSERRSGVEEAGSVFFDEWQGDIAAVSDPAARGRQQQEYDKLRAPYDRLLDAMRGAEASLGPVLQSMDAELAALRPAATAAATPGIDPVAGDRAVRNLQLAVALADQYIAELENLP